MAYPHKKTFTNLLRFIQKAWLGILLIVMPTMIWGAVSFQDDRTARQGGRAVQEDGDTLKPKVRKTEIRRQITIQEDTIPDSLLHPRWKILKSR